MAPLDQRSAKCTLVKIFIQSALLKFHGIKQPRPSLLFQSNQGHSLFYLLQNNELWNSYQADNLNMKNLKSFEKNR